MKTPPIESFDRVEISIYPPKLESDPNVNTFKKWLQKESAFTSPDIANEVCFIRLMKLKGQPACFLVLATPDKRDATFLGDTLVLGSTFAWPMADSTLSKDDFLSKIEADFKSFSKNCQTTDCIFYAASKVVVGYRNNDYRVLNLK